MANPTELELAWMAGFFDGEGSICIHRRRVRRKHGSREFTYS